MMVTCPKKVVRSMLKAFANTSTSISASRSASINKWRFSISERARTAKALKLREPFGKVILRAVARIFLTKAAVAVAVVGASTLTTVNKPFA